MHCKTEKEASDFCRVIDDIRKNNKNNICRISIGVYDVYKEDTCFLFNLGKYCSLDYAINNKNNEKYIILEWSEFMEKAIKPPIGIKPKYIWEQERFDDIFRAISEYYNAGLKIPVEWIEEYNELIGVTKENGLEDN